jgi:hypothetical protein
VPVSGNVPTSLGFMGILENGHDQQRCTQAVLATQVHAYIHIDFYK